MIQYCDHCGYKVIGQRTVTGVSEQENTSSVKQEDVADIMNRINSAIQDMGYVAAAYDNTGIWLEVIIDKS